MTVGTPMSLTRLSVLLLTLGAARCVSNDTTHSAVRDAVAPSWPIDAHLSVTKREANQIALRWTAATDDVRIARYIVDSGGGRRQYVGGTSTRVTALRPGTTYTFSVRAVDGAGNGTPTSLAAKAATLGGCEVTVPAVPHRVTP